MTAKTEYLSQKVTGVSRLKKRISVFYYFLLIIPVAVYVMFYLYNKQEVKSVTIRVSSLRHENGILEEEYRRLVSKYDQIASSKDIRTFATDKLAMCDMESNVESFVVVDRVSVFSGSRNTTIMKLFNDDVNLAHVKGD